MLRLLFSTISPCLQATRFTWKKKNVAYTHNESRLSRFDNVRRWIFFPFLFPQLTEMNESGATLCFVIWNFVSCCTWISLPTRIFSSLFLTRSCRWFSSLLLSFSSTLVVCFPAPPLVSSREKPPRYHPQPNRQIPVLSYFSLTDVDFIKWVVYISCCLLVLSA